MSLFPAYADDGANDETKNTIPENLVENNWLTQPSFPSAVFDVIIPSDSTESEPEIIIAEPKAKKKKKKKKLPVETPPPSFENELYVIDSQRDLGYLNMDKLSKRCRPKYIKSSLVKMKNFQPNLKKPIRYFSKNVATRSGQNDEQIGEDLKKNVEILNTAVRENPTSIDDWMKLIIFQDDYFKYQPIQFKTAAERDRAINSQKLSIIERAMNANMGHEKLQKLWLELARECLTADEIERKLLELMKNNEHSLIMCLGDIALNQLSMPRCKISPVMRKYQHAMERLQKSRNLSSTGQDSATLELFFYACVFLQQSGLWEMSWTAIKLILQLNLSLDLTDVSADDNRVLNEEEEIIKEGKNIPVWHLWTRLELLRQGYHFYPAESSEYFPQRIVGNEEVVHLVHHVRRNAQFRLLCLLPILSNVPLLPLTHAFLTSISSQLAPWAFDSVEWHLSALFTNSPLLKINDEFLTRHLPKSHPPQYLQNYHGQTEFLKLTNEIFEKLLGVTVGRQRDAIGVWYIRFLRFLSILSARKIYKNPANFTKLTGLAKRFLAKNENRDNPILYIEYSLFLSDMGEINQSIAVMEAILLSKRTLYDENDDKSKAYYFAVYRTMSEIQIAAGLLDDAKATLKKLTRTESDAISSIKLKQIAQNSLTVDNSDDLEDLMLPDLTTESVSCYVYFLTSTGNTLTALAYLDEILKTDLKPFIRERLYTIYIGLIRSSTDNEPRAEIIITLQMLHEFPYNPLPLMILGETMTNGGGLWWKDMTYLIHMPNNMGAVIAVCAVLERQHRNGENNFRCRGLLDRLSATGNNVSTIVHRINLGMLKELGDLEALESARLRALEAYPWNKGLYMDAITSCPAQLLPLTDLIVEKDLRIHITLDEVEELRN